MGTIKKEILTEKDAYQVLESFASILTKVGKLKRVNKHDLKILGRMKFGLQSVPIKIKIKRRDNDTTIQILAWSDDIWSYAAKDSVSRLMKFYDDPFKEVKEEHITGLKPFYIGLIITAFYWLLKITFDFFENYNLWDYAIIFGSIVIVYFIISRIRFNFL